MTTMRCTCGLPMGFCSAPSSGARPADFKPWGMSTLDELKMEARVRYLNSLRARG